jgi:hypothetical protein
MSTGQVMIQKVTNKLLDMIVNEVNKEEMRVVIRKKILNPLLHMIYIEVAPYIYGFIIIMMAILILSLMTFVMFLLSAKK